MNLKRYLFFLAFLFPLMVFSQSETIQQTLENLSENQDVLLDYSELIEELENLESHPINLNSNQVDQLHQLFLLDEYQLENLKTYISDNGALLSINELLLIDGFTKKNIEIILPFIEVKPLDELHLPNLQQLSNYGNHDLFLRYQRLLEKPKAYQDYNAGDNINSFYLGNPDKYFIKYKYSYSKLFQCGFTAEKDAGELFLRDTNNEELQTEITDYFKKGFDFSTFHLYGQDIGIIKQIAIGDYHLLFGQGLTLWTGLSFGKSANAVQLKRFESFIKPNTSSNENGFLRGAAIHLGKNHWSSVFFYSKNKQDATLQTAEDGTEYVSTLLYTGLHRTVLELSKKDLIDIQLFGGHFKYSLKTISLGFTAYNTTLSREIKKSDTPDNLFDFNGDNLTNYGLDYTFRVWKANFFGELSLSSVGGKAFISGISLAFNSRMKLSLLYRNYEKDYQNLFASALSENSSPNNEKGFYAGTQIVLSKKLSLQANADFFSFPWLKYEQDSPSKGVEYRALLFYDYTSNVDMHFKFKYKQKEVNSRAQTTGEINYLEEEVKTSFQYQINYKLNERFRLRNRIEITKFTKSKLDKSLGFMLFQDLNYQSLNQHFGSNTRLAIFNTDNFSSANYAYENDVLYAFSIPAYSGKGIRFYQLISYKLNNAVKLWLRYSLSYYPNEETIGSGLDEINGSIKSEVKLQVRIKI